MSARVSVVIPVYNRTWELRRALSSLAEQTSPPFEVVVCDDGSEDDVAGVVREFDAVLATRFVRIPNSGGPARPRNVAVSHCRGEWISFLDSDDWWRRDRMGAVCHELRPDVDVVYHPLRVVEDSGQVGVGRERGLVGAPLVGNPLVHMALRGNPIPNSAAVVRLTALQVAGGLSEDRRLVAYEDFDLWLKLAEAGSRFHFIKDVLGYYWQGADAISALKPQHVLRREYLYRKHRSSFKGVRRRAAAFQHYSLASMWWRIPGGETRAWKHLRLASQVPTLQRKVSRLFRMCVIRLRWLGEALLR